MKFKVGDKVRFSDKADFGVGVFNKDIYKIERLGIAKGYPYHICDDNGVSFGFDEHELIKVEDNMFKVGDIVTNNGDNKQKVLDVGDNLIALSYINNYTTYLDHYTEEYLKEFGYTLYTEPEVKEMTVKDISEELGYDVKIIKED